MHTPTANLPLKWNNTKNWKKSAKNTAWCLLGCAVGDNLTILYFQFFSHHTHMLTVMLLASLMGLFTSVSLEVIILRKQMSFKSALKTALGMSFISMLIMESIANLTAILFAGGNRLLLSVGSLIPSWSLGFLGAWVYNYFRITKYGKACH